eukprot:SAG25_NODE_53_length_18703_cov_126.779104_7_plen_110_part_00
MATAVAPTHSRSCATALAPETLVPHQSGPRCDILLERERASVRSCDPVASALPKMAATHTHPPSTQPAGRGTLGAGASLTDEGCCPGEEGAHLVYRTSRRTESCPQTSS